MKESKGLLGVEIVGGLEETSTAWAGTSLLIELYRHLGLDGIANKVIPAKGSSKGLKHGQMIESFVVLSALGGECIDDMKRLREDEGLAGILNYRPPAPETARQWLDRFHDESTMLEQPLQGSFIPLESKPLAGLKEVNRRILGAYVEATESRGEVTLDVDAQLIETSKANARYCYSDSAAYEQDVLDHWDSRHWGFAVSADMSTQLRQEIERLPDDAWNIWETEKSGMIREWAEVPYVPARNYEDKGSHPYRYLAVRVRRQQGQLFEDGVSVRHFAVVTNMWDREGQELLEWQRGKAGTIETVEVRSVHHNGVVGQPRRENAAPHS